MICFPNAKINLGLNIIEKRPDGFHNIETVFYPVGWSDILEITESAAADRFNLFISGLQIQGELKENLLYKAYQLINQEKQLPSVNVYLHKAIPMGAGLGGGSSDAAFFINLMNEQFGLELSLNQRMGIARQLGSDCAFFIQNKAVIAKEKGDVFESLRLDLSAYYIALVYPDVHSNTKEAYSLVKPHIPSHSLTEIIQLPVERWKEFMANDFENSIFHKYPVVKSVKEKLYKNGALYAAMSGSGSAVFGIFDQKPELENLSHFPHWVGRMM